MPELPEVEAARRAVELHCKGGLIRRAMVADDTTVIEGMVPFDMQRTLVGKRIVAAHRKGKQLWLEMDEPVSICFQFGMAGAVYIKGVKSTKYVRSAVKDEDEWPSKYSKVLLELDTGVQMSFTDKRRFARVRLLENPATSSPISELGPDAFTELPEETEFAESVMKKKTAIKAILLDQSFLAGIGNWIADEVLYQSKIHPEQPASTLSVEDCNRLRNSIKEVIETAVDAEADSAEYPTDWITHHREKKKADASINGKKIDFITVGGRTSAYVPELQKYDGVLKKKTRKKKKEEDDDDDEKEEVETRKTRGKKAAAGAAKVQKRGQAKAAAEEVQEEKPKKRGRPAKTKLTARKPSSDNEETDEEEDDDDDEKEEVETTKTRGKKAAAGAAKVQKRGQAKAAAEEQVQEPEKPKKRGRPARAKVIAEKPSSETDETGVGSGSRTKSERKPRVKKSKAS